MVPDEFIQRFVGNGAGLSSFSAVFEEETGQSACGYREVYVYLVFQVAAYGLQRQFVDVLAFIRKADAAYCLQDIGGDGCRIFKPLSLVPVYERADLVIVADSQTERV